MQIRLFLLTLLVASNHQVVSTIVLATFQQEALARHNYYRQLHCVGLLQLNSTLNGRAQSYAEFLATNNSFQHSGAAGLGENLYWQSSSAMLTYVNGSSPTNSWYNEISLYNFSSPGFSSSTGHFTQVVWKATTQLGIGIALSSDGKKAYIVANYYVAGNLLGAFGTNVLPLCSATQGTSAATTSAATTTTKAATTTTTKATAATTKAATTTTKAATTTTTKATAATTKAATTTTKAATTTTTKATTATTKAATTTMTKAPTTTTKGATTTTTKATATTRRRRGREVVQN